jgi:hypothetical protein
MKTKIFLVFLTITLAACAPAQTNTENAQNTAVAIVQTGVALTQMALPTATLPLPTFTSTALPTPIPALPPPPILTPDTIQVERWKEYETALAKSIFSSLPPEVVLCEWEILGRSEQEVYVWVVCQNQHSTGSLPAVIYLDTNGSIQSVATTENTPGGYGENIRKLFPPNIQEIIFDNLINDGRLISHLASRRENSDPPLIVLEATTLP